ncbi:hypothetical protein PV416_45530 [Streptomyces ipomoeae]|nr:hypothetical protein [Streptomyces ipomoeae]MDX2700483.1 hypothetical protein [Streptomyces ipomoeae]MDX2828124.1 hypothetical protein [Streptomyces ipomoeae]MDX2844610.1 hypothetical protein [Streptomyces ipomoeae]MDX2880643.1 hypothetical protein [Streptomyces ipomoeae]MDX2938319.1 hypothetical protein [Streptomyces ipomoeae]
MADATKSSTHSSTHKQRERGPEPGGPAPQGNDPEAGAPSQQEPNAEPADERGDAARRRRRAQFLRELTEARELRDRVQPRRAKAARLRHAMRMRTFRW